MRHIFGRLAAMAILMAMAGRADAETFNFAFIGPGLSGSGMLTATPNGNGSFTATAGTLSVSGDPLATSGTLFPNPSAPTPSLSPSQFFIYDDQLFPSHNPVLDVDGLLFTTPTNEINIWANGPGSFEYFDFNTKTGAQYDNTNFQFLLVMSPVPEPGSLTLMGLGVVGLATLVLRKRINRPEPLRA